MNPETHNCDCGYTWRHGHSGTHLCGPQYRATIERQAQEIAALKSQHPVTALNSWPTDEMVVRGAEQLHDCLRSAGVAHDFDAELQGTEIQQDIAESVFKSMLEIAVPVERQDAIDAARMLDIARDLQEWMADKPNGPKQSVDTLVNFFEGNGMSNGRF